MTEEVPSNDGPMPSLEGLVTRQFCRVFDVAGHQIMFWYETYPGKMRQNAAIEVVKLGRVTYQKDVDCYSLGEATRWLESLDHMMARRTLAFLKSKAKRITDAFEEG